MDSRDILILAVVGIGGWWLYRRSQAMPKAAALGNPTAAASMTTAGRRATLVGQSIVSGISGAPFMPRDPIGGFIGGGGSFARNVAALVAADATPPAPPPAPNAFFWQGTAIPAGRGRGASTMGTNPLPPIYFE